MISRSNWDNESLLGARERSASACVCVVLKQMTLLRFSFNGTSFWLQMERLDGGNNARFSSCLEV
jgi:hypothetical protein